MRRRGKRLLALALAGVMAASALTGCEKIEEKGCIRKHNSCQGSR